MKDLVQTNTSSYTLPNGKLFIAGDVKAVQSDALLDDFFDLLGDQARIEIIGAKTDAPEFSEWFGALKQRGAAHVGHILYNDQSAADTHARLNNAHAVYFLGSDDADVSQQLLPLLKKRYQSERLVIAGVNPRVLQLFTTGVAGIADVMIETGCAYHSPFVHMSASISTGSIKTGICVEENAAVIIQDGSDIVVTGEGVVYVVQSGDNDQSNHANVAAYGLKVNILSKGQTFKLPLLNTASV